MRNPNVTCTVCGAPFYSRPSLLAKGWGKYCTTKCRAVGEGRNIYPTTKKCKHCGEVFTILGKRFRKRKFCSRSCAAKSNNPGRQGVKYKRGYTNFRNLLLHEYGHQCMISNCGYNRFVDSHHIKKKSNGGSDKKENGILLCPTHHREADNMFISEEKIIKHKEHFLKDRCPSG